MTKYLIIFLIIITFGCKQKEEELTSLCHEIKILNLDIELRINKLYDRLELISKIFREESYKVDFERAKRIDSLFSKFSHFIQEKNIEEIDTQLPLIHKILDEVRSVTPSIKQYLKTDNNEKPLYWLTHEELNAIKTINNCNELNQYKLNQIEEKLLLNCSDIYINTYHFNKVKPVAFSNESNFIENDTFSINVGFLAYDTTKNQFIKYRIDDSINNNEFTHKGEGPIFIKAEKGKHKINGRISIIKRGIRNYIPWEFEYQTE
jgi:hypothetical protein